MGDIEARSKFELIGDSDSLIKIGSNRVDMSEPDSLASTYAFLPRNVVA